MTNAPRFSPNRRQIVFIGFADVNLLDLAGPIQVFAAANALSGSRLYDLRLFANAAPLMTSAGIGLAATPLPAHPGLMDTMIVAGGHGHRHARQDRRLTSWISRAATRARRVASVCTGAFLLGAAGLLNGRRVVTHWAECQDLARAYPTATVIADAIFVVDGNLWSSAGVTAGIDMALAMVEADHGSALALAIARDLVVFLRRPGGQAQFSTVLDLQAKDQGFADLHARIAARPARDWTTAALAQQVGMSERSFMRHYRRATGFTPARAVERLRVEAARTMLAAGRQSIKAVAHRSGFGSAETMRRSFLRQLNVTPQDYRQRFQPS